MGVYNPLAKMPRACGECEDRFKCQYSDMTIPRRSDDCPLIEVKAPHGRLVDIDKTMSIVASGVRLEIGELSELATVIEAEVE